MLTSRLTFLKVGALFGALCPLLFKSFFLFFNWQAFSSTTSSSLQRVLFGGNRYVSQANGNSGNIGGEIIKQALKRNFPNAADIVVQDISGGCGAMFEVYVVSDEFKGVARVKQHLAVSNVSGHSSSLKGTNID